MKRIKTIRIIFVNVFDGGEIEKKISDYFKKLNKGCEFKVTNLSKFPTAEEKIEAGIIISDACTYCKSYTEVKAFLKANPKTWLALYTTIEGFSFLVENASDVKHCLRQKKEGNINLDDINNLLISNYLLS